MLDYRNITTMKPSKTVSIRMVQPTNSRPLVKVRIDLAKVASLSPLNPEHEFKEAAAEPAHPASFSQADLTNEDSSFSVKDTIAKKRAVKAVRKPRSSKPKVNEDEKSYGPVDYDRIRKAVKKIEERPVNQPRRGRKPLKEDQYLSDSLKRIDELELRLVTEKDNLTTHDKDIIRN